MRTCPNCNYQYSRLEYVKDVFFMTIRTDIECKNCNQNFTIELSRRIILAFAFGFWLILVNTARTSLDMNNFLWMILIVFLLAGGLFIFTFDNFNKVDD